MPILGFVYAIDSKCITTDIKKCDSSPIKVRKGNYFVPLTPAGSKQHRSNTGRLYITHHAIDYNI
jgi:hypothetical protein